MLLSTEPFLQLPGPSSCPTAATPLWIPLCEHLTRSEAPTLPYPQTHPDRHFMEPRTASVLYRVLVAFRSTSQPREEHTRNLSSLTIINRSFYNCSADSTDDIRESLSNDHSLTRAMAAAVCRLWASALPCSASANLGAGEIGQWLGSLTPPPYREDPGSFPHPHGIS